MTRNDPTAAFDQTTRVWLQSPREENKQPAARRSSKNAIYEPLSTLKKRFKPYLTTTPLHKFDFYFQNFLKTNILAAKNQKKNTFLFLKKITWTTYMTTMTYDDNQIYFQNWMCVWLNLPFGFFSLNFLCFLSFFKNRTVFLKNPKNLFCPSQQKLCCVSYKTSQEKRSTANNQKKLSSHTPKKERWENVLQKNQWDTTKKEPKNNHLRRSFFWP